MVTGGGGGKKNGRVNKILWVEMGGLIKSRSRYRKKLPAAAANQIAGNQKISLGMQKKKLWLPFAYLDC